MQGRRLRRIALSAFTMAALTAAPAACGGGSEGPSTLSQEDLITKVTPSVVKLSGRRGESGSGGSGVVIDARRGYVLTNAHVIAGLSALQAKVGDLASTQTAARVVAQAPCDDLALVKLVDVPANLRALALGNSSVRRGQHVTALGYPSSFEDPAAQTVVATSGTVSSPQVAAEPDPSLPRYPSTIQHQAPINPGNSGGPLVDDQARVIGLNTLGNTQQGGRAIQGQYYAISANHIKSLLPDLEAGRSTAYAGWALAPVQAIPIARIFATDPDWQAPRLGVTVAATLRATNAQGLYVLGSDTGSPAEDSDIVFGDMVTSLEGTSVRTVADVCDVLESHNLGDKLFVRGRYLNSAKNSDQVLHRWHARITLGG